MASSSPTALGSAATPDLVTLGQLAQRPTVAGAVEAIRDFLGMEIAFTGEFVETEQVFRILRGDGRSFGITEGGRMPLRDTYCERVLRHRLPNLMPDVRREERAAALSITEEAEVGAFVSIPLRFSDGRLYGTLCAASHQTKPEMGYRELQFLHVFARIVVDQLEREAAMQTRVNLEAQAAATQALVVAIEARDAYTARHCQAVVDYAVAVAEELGLDTDAIEEVRQVALLHDIGKIAIPDAILHKPGRLDPDEWKVMQTHPLVSEELICEITGLEHLAPAIRAEHEHWDGSGYPDGLAGEGIPLAARITLACDAYHAMTSDRPYRAAMAPEAARGEIEMNLGSQFCPAAGGALIDLLDRR